MNFSELRQSFETLTGTDEPEDAQLAIWFNEAMLDLAPVLGNIVKQTYPDDSEEDPLVINDDGTYPLPSDYLNITNCSARYRIYPNRTILFYDTNGGTVDIWYRQTPALYQLNDTLQDTECPLHPFIHDLIPLWAASRYWDMESEGDGEESGHGTKWMNYYLRGKAYALTYLQQGDKFSDGDRWIIED